MGEHRYASTSLASFREFRRVRAASSHDACEVIDAAANDLQRSPEQWLRRFWLMARDSRLTAQACPCSYEKGCEVRGEENVPDNRLSSRSEFRQTFEPARVGIKQTLQRMMRLLPPEAQRREVEGWIARASGLTGKHDLYGKEMQQLQDMACTDTVQNLCMLMLYGGEILLLPSIIISFVSLSGLWIPNQEARML